MNTLHNMLPRDGSVGDKFKELLNNDPLGAKVQQTSVLVAIGTALGISAAIFLVFLLLRPFNTIVYAPRLRHADEKHRPPPMDKSLFAWYRPVFKTNEDAYVHMIGLDATIFLRFARMCRNMFVVLSIVGCGIIIPVNVIKGVEFNKKGNFAGVEAIMLMTPKSLFGPILWAFVVVAYLFNIIVCGFLWWTYRAVHRLRRNYLEGSEYQNALHSRTLMITDIKRNFRSDQGLVEITDSLRTTPEVPRATVGRNVKDIPDLIEEHEKAVIQLESVLAKYLKNPNQLPATRPLCAPSKKDPEFTDKKQKVDAIDYLTARIQRLEGQIKEARETVDKRDAMPYGFASYETIESAHTVAYAARNKHPKGTTVRLAPKPKDVIWKNLLLDAKTRRWRRFINHGWISLLTILYFIPNALIAIFLSKLPNLALVWEAFSVELNRHPGFWAVVQGILAPALTSLFYYFLPIIFRRLSMRAGDFTKTSRERHVTAQLYNFFVFNNLFVFSLFSAAFGMITLVVKYARDEHQPFMQIIREIQIFDTIMQTLCNVSPFWVTWLVQRNLGAAIDLSQVANLAWGSFSRKFLNPTPRELITRTAPPPFDYASYYNYFLFYSTVALCFAPLQPVTLVVVAFYFSIDSWMKKYLLMYVFCTKNESGGLYWRILFNRMLVGVMLSNCIIALLCVARGFDLKWTMLGAMVPLPLGLVAFKFYCKNTFDNSIKYYTIGDIIKKGSEAPPPIDKESRRRDRVAVRFGHPALYQKLTVPMVHEKSKHLLAEVYRGRLDGDLGDTAAFSDTYTMKRMSKDHPGKTAAQTGPFEFVAEDNMDFENFKNRPEFSDEHGGGGSVYGDASTIGRPDTPGSAFGDRGRSTSRDSARTLNDEPGMTYPAGYHQTPSNLREYSPSPAPISRIESNSSPYEIPPQTNLLSGAAPMGHDQYTPYSPNRDGQQDYFRR
ncbi:hypothetical protein HBI56_112130 [Parastagonospora nodorum]|uniref:DUF221-domain-containing protein n=1 Tax=Phaeosphaeria nodorum (strain SN15 / ATCC MYA-4574 / FGSC 10173) TaxID=321614 RepID=A0A7U2ETE8_PHANO|nr:hypothetical protein HBH56_044760 [Parastagonospora nodorum]QRC92741.1 hypothetical protein JI435_082020 [Parastagonospora nodorum SN15]KAH3933234.1 hypothetical protein HBH54_072510 [Parastagonospora nodorum]KAH3973281.1 hypothetical protein HBH52_144560 [Parastagonospora nodorum]KAH4004084.1 hypothetical protein HBI10_051500 [Parastagonospora nodorum]